MTNSMERSWMASMTGGNSMAATQSAVVRSNMQDEDKTLLMRNMIKARIHYRQNVYDEFEENAPFRM